MAIDQLEDSLDCERSWENFRRPLQLSNQDDTQKYHRLNIKLDGNLPELDKVDKIPFLESEAEEFCIHNRPMIRQVATKLIASLFYFTLGQITPVLGDQNKWDCTG